MTSQAVKAPQPESTRAALAQTLDEALNRLIDGPEYSPGARLPTERELAERFEVSRGAIRAALARVEGRGRIVRVMGSGTYIADVPADAVGPAIAPVARDASPQEILEARMMIEPHLAALVVLHANSADMDRIRSAMRSAEAASSLDAFEHWDGKFHQAIAEATHNRLLIDICQTLNSARDLAEWGELKRRSVTPDRRAAREAEHREIVSALQSRDAGRARTACVNHLRKISGELIGHQG
ncbi:FadR/GntR family transcriptional regulator [Bordetella sp. BOR01]|uniref:FadR/GntR family transcriptional regulator n=1 Tax=Bordetella sp. BOR01 TaxID=2854779 RepID=UPI001C469BB1|nr:FCD domain-containing protein [Bordetella sp. BOR01]MBV7484271.1 FCD domain-containing protein [Bordetella sp. BOR01]